MNERVPLYVMQRKFWLHICLVTKPLVWLQEDGKEVKRTFPQQLLERLERRGFWRTRTRKDSTRGLECLHHSLALKRPNLLKAVSLLSWAEHVRRPHKVRPLHTGSSLALTWPSGVAGTFRFEVTRLQFLFVYLANSIFIQIILGFGVDVSRQG